MRKIIGAAAFALLCLVSAARAVAAPHVPASDAIVLDRVPAANAARRLEPLRRALAAQPDDLQAALQLARGYLDIGHETSDPRFVSYAYSTLTPWLRREDPPAAALVLAATALQSTHRFAEALSMLDRALAIEPDDGQAWLTKATVLQVQGKFTAAREACRRVLRTADRLVALTCLLSVDSRSGRLASSYVALQRILEVSPGSDENVRAWTLGQLGDMAERLDDPKAAEQYFKAAMRTAPADVYLKAAHADVLLRLGRAREVTQLLKDYESHDALLLRLAIAGRKVDTPDAKGWIESYDARRRATRPDDNPHAREHARFMLEVRDQPREALELARQSWQVQREPADVRLYLQAAQRTGRPEAAAVVLEWIRSTGYEDLTVESRLPAAAGASQ